MSSEQPKPGSGQSKRSIGGTLSKELTKAMQQRVDQAYQLMESQ